MSLLIALKRNWFFRNSLKPFIVTSEKGKFYARSSLHLLGAAELHLLMLLHLIVLLHVHLICVNNWCAIGSRLDGKSLSCWGLHLIAHHHVLLLHLEVRVIVRLLHRLAICVMNCAGDVGSVGGRRAGGSSSCAAPVPDDAGATKECQEEPTPI